MTLPDRALAFATRAHGAIDHRRKYTGEAYIVHPIAVAEIVRSVSHTEEMLAPATAGHPELLAPLPTQTTQLPGHRVAGRGCPGFAPRVLYATGPDKLPSNCESITPL